MNIKIGEVSSIVNLLAVLGFATSMLLRYALMALATFFAGLTICLKKKTEKWLRTLLLIHGVFFIICLLLPMLGIFQADSPRGLA